MRDCRSGSREYDIHCRNSSGSFNSVSLHQFHFDSFWLWFISMFKSTAILRHCTEVANENLLSFLRDKQGVDLCSEEIFKIILEAHNLSRYTPSTPPTPPTPVKPWPPPDHQPAGNPFTDASRKEPLTIFMQGKEGMHMTLLSVSEFNLFRTIHFMIPFDCCINITFSFVQLLVWMPPLPLPLPRSEPRQNLQQKSSCPWKEGLERLHVLLARSQGPHSSWSTLPWQMRGLLVLTGPLYPIVVETWSQSAGLTVWATAEQLPFSYSYGLCLGSWSRR